MSDATCIACYSTAFSEAKALMKEGDKPAKQETVEWTVSVLVYAWEALSSIRAVISCYLKSE